ncbi:MAG TPA: hypothetical protein VIM71_06150 [Lacunisphaera sp.]
MKFLLLLLAVFVLSRGAAAEASDTDKLLAILGKNISGKEAQALIASPDSKSESQRHLLNDPLGGKDYGRTYWTYKDHGMEIHTDDDGIVTDIIFYSERADGFSRYQGPLPYGLDFTMSRSVVEKTIGAPSKAFEIPELTKAEGRVLKACALYPEKQVMVAYKTKLRSDMSALLYSVTLSTGLDQGR